SDYVGVGKNIPNSMPRGGQGEPFSKMQVPLPTDESIKHLVVPKGFRAELFVSEAELGDGKPICMNWDERGRLWVALTLDYPNELQPPGQGHDRIVICEDTDGDGKADKVTTLAASLSTPPSTVFARGGAMVFDATRRSSSRIPTATARPTPARCCSAPGRCATRTAGPVTCSTAWTTGFTGCR